MSLYSKATKFVKNQNLTWRDMFEDVFPETLGKNGYSAGEKCEGGKAGTSCPRPLPASFISYFFNGFTKCTGTGELAMTFLATLPNSTLTWSTFSAPRP